MRVADVPTGPVPPMKRSFNAATLPGRAGFAAHRSASGLLTDPVALIERESLAKLPQLAHQLREALRQRVEACADRPVREIRVVFDRLAERPELPHAAVEVDDLGPRAVAAPQT